MNNLQPYQPPYTFPTSLPETPGGLTPYQKAQRETDFVNAPQFQNRRIVTVAVVALCVATLVTHIVTHGINRRAAFASLVAVAVAFLCRNYSIPKQ